MAAARKSEDDADKMALYGGGIGAAATILGWLVISFVAADFSVTASGVRLLIAMTVVGAAVGYIGMRISNI